MKLITPIIYVGTLFGSQVFAQPAEGDSPEKAAVTALAREYESAFAKGDAATLAGFFAEDAEQTTEEGTLLQGRAEIEKAIAQGLKANKGAKLTIDVASAKALTPDVVVEKGTTTLVTKEGEASSSLYTAVHVKKDGKWKISQLTETVLPPQTSAEHLAELEWLVGSWAEKDGETSVESSFQWARGGNFLTRNVTVKTGDETTLEGWQVIGWDESKEQIRSWTFDTGGGFSEGTWTGDGNRWLIRESGTLTDGRRTTAEQTIVRIDDKKFTWEANNRTLDGEPQPSIGRLEIKRVEGK